MMEDWSECCPASRWCCVRPWKERRCALSCCLRTAGITKSSCCWKVGGAVGSELKRLRNWMRYMLSVVPGTAWQLCPWLGYSAQTVIVRWCFSLTFLPCDRPQEVHSPEHKNRSKRKRCEVWGENSKQSDWKRVGDWPVGMKNIGNTCWFSAVIQVTWWPDSSVTASVLETKCLSVRI